MKKSYKIILAVVVVLIVAGGVGFAVFRNQAGQSKAVKNFDELAKCLTQKGAVMYGAYWCPHCQRQKKEFGDSFKYVKYVECTKETKTCQSKKVDGYPTWIFKNGSRNTGELKLEELAKKTNCKMPKGD